MASGAKPKEIWGSFAPSCIVFRTSSLTIGLFGGNALPRPGVHQHGSLSIIAAYPSLWITGVGACSMGLQQKTLCYRQSRGYTSTIYAF